MRGGHGCAGTVVTLLRAIEVKRLSDFQKGGEFRADALNDDSITRRPRSRRPG